MRISNWLAPLATVVAIAIAITPFSTRSFGATAAAANQHPATSTHRAAIAGGPPSAGTFRLHAIDVGTGLSIFVEGHDFALLYDAGSRDDSAGGVNNRVLAYLRAVRPDLRTIDHLILSHPHQDHDEMMDSVLGAYQVRSVWDSGSLGDACGYRAFLDAVIAEPHVTYHDALGSGGTHDAHFSAAAGCHGRTRPAGLVRVPRGSQIAFRAPIPLGAGAQMTILYANGNAPAGDLNQASVVVRLDLGSRRILLPGDAQGGERELPSSVPDASSIEGWLLAHNPSDLQADLLVVGHHGSLTSSRAAFVRAVGARQFIISSGPFPYSGHVLPDHEIRDELAAIGTLWRTDFNDAACRTNAVKIGVDRRGSGGCDNVLVAIDAAGTMNVGYDRRAD